MIHASPFLTLSAQSLYVERIVIVCPQLVTTATMSYFTIIIFTYFFFEGGGGGGGRWVGLGDSAG